MTQSTGQERAEFTDGAWYWVEKEGWHDEPPKIAPAMYRADCDAWYSWEFSGISTEYLKVMEPCVRHEQAARRAPAAPVPQGWKMVPVEPTREMIDAMPPVEETGYWAMYEAALAAAPQPPEAEDGPSSCAHCGNPWGEAAPIDPQLLQAIQCAGFQVIKGALGYELMKLGQAYAQADHIPDAGKMVAAPVQLPENLREGEPYDNPAFEALARALGVWGTAQSAVCAQFWIAAKEQST